MCCWNFLIRQINSCEGRKWDHYGGGRGNVLLRPAWRLAPDSSVIVWLDGAQFHILVQSFLTKDYFLPVYCYIIFPTHKIILAYKNWLNDDQVRNGTRSHTSITTNKLAKRSEEHSSSHTNRPQNCAPFSVIIILWTIDLVRQNSGFQHFSPHH